MGSHLNKDELEKILNFFKNNKTQSYINIFKPIFIILMVINTIIILSFIKTFFLH